MAQSDGFENRSPVREAQVRILYPPQGLSQEDFAKKSGVKYTTLTKIESNVIKKPSVLIMAKLAKALGVSIEDLIK